MYTYTHTLTVTCHHREHPELSNEQLMKLLLVGASLNDVGIDVDTFAFSLRITVVDYMCMGTYHKLITDDLLDTNIFTAYVHAPTWILSLFQQRAKQGELTTLDADSFGEFIVFL